MNANLITVEDRIERLERLLDISGYILRLEVKDLIDYTYTLISAVEVDFHPACGYTAKEFKEVFEEILPDIKRSIDTLEEPCHKQIALIVIMHCEKILAYHLEDF